MLSLDEITLYSPASPAYSAPMQPTDHDRQETDEPTDGHAPRRVSVPEAALLLGISEDAVRSRLRRRTLGKEKAPDGTVFVILGGATGADRPPTGADQPTTDHATDRTSVTVTEVLRDQVEHLRQQLDAEREANRENRRIIAALVGRVPELEARVSTEAAPEPPEQRETAPEDAERVETPAPENGAQRRPWWRRWFS